MKSHKKFWLTLIALVAGAVILALPFALKVLQDEGFEGVWKRKRANIEKVAPDSAPILDEAERSVKGSGSR